MAEGNGMVDRGVAALNAGRCVGEGVSEDEFRLALLAALDPEDEALVLAIAARGPKGFAFDKADSYYKYRGLIRKEAMTYARASLAALKAMTQGEMS